MKCFFARDLGLGFGTLLAVVIYIDLLRCLGHQGKGVDPRPGRTPKGRKLKTGVPGLVNVNSLRWKITIFIGYIMVYLGYNMVASFTLILKCRTIRFQETCKPFLFSRKRGTNRPHEFQM